MPKSWFPYLKFGKSLLSTKSKKGNKTVGRLLIESGHSIS